MRVQFKWVSNFDLIWQWIISFKSIFEWCQNVMQIYLTLFLKKSWCPGPLCYQAIDVHDNLHDIRTLLTRTKNFTFLRHPSSDTDFALEESKHYLTKWRSNGSILPSTDLQAAGVSKWWIVESECFQLKAKSWRELQTYICIMQGCVIIEIYKKQVDPIATSSRWVHFTYVFR